MRMKHVNYTIYPLRNISAYYADSQRLRYLLLDQPLTLLLFSR